ncbi:MAG: hypothetical protein ACRCVJ_12020 [Clostridium sp.]|uniref:hypothetical protein n=1 Tax=Clostridium sp. TaxID=1506 RepID=UPI003F2F8C4D
MIKSYSRGHEIYFENNKWFYKDNNEEIREDRPCKRCGCNPTKEGYDACLGFVKGKTSACCGHGVEKGYEV